MQDERTVSPALRDDDPTLRPRSLDEFIGQDQLRRNLKIYLEAARRRKEPVDHILFSGPPGLGKTTLAHIVANEVGTRLRASSGPVLERPADLAGVLTKLGEQDVLFIDEIHRLRPVVEEYLYAAMEDFCIDILIDEGPHARSVKIDIPPFTLIGATTREGLLSGPFRARFGVLQKLEYYPAEDLLKVVQRAAQILKVKVDRDAAELIAARSRGTPRDANRFLKRIRDLAEVKASGHVTRQIAEAGLAMLGVDEVGLDNMDRKILRALTRHGNIPVGLKTVAVTVGETEDTIEDVYEPYLIQQGFIRKTPRGRVATRSAFEHLRQAPPEDAVPGLFNEMDEST